MRTPRKGQHFFFMGAALLLVLIQAITLTNAFILSPITTRSTKVVGHDTFPYTRTAASSKMFTTQKDDDEDENVYYDDFADFDFQTSTNSVNGNVPVDGGGGDALLSQLLVESKKKQGEQEARISQNWKSGNWNVRGFALDKVDFTTEDTSSNAEDTSRSSSGLLPDDMTQMEFQKKIGSAPKLRRGDGASSQKSREPEESPPIEVCQIVLDEDALYDDASDVMAVGRTDGSIFLIQMGSEYLTKFRTVPRISINEETKDGDLMASIKSELVDENVLVDKMKKSIGMDSTSSNPNSGAVANAPFEILHQFRVGDRTGDSISSLLFHGTRLFTSAGVNGDIQVWDIALDLSDEQEETMKKTECKPLRTLTNAHSDKIIVLKTLSSNVSNDRDEDDASHHNLLFSASLDGSIALWDLKSGDLVYRCQMTDADDSGNGDISVTCADVDRVGSEHFLYLGLSSGHIVGYAVSALIGHASIGDNCPVPTCRFTAHQPKYENKQDEASGVTSLVCGGEGTLTTRGTGGGANKNTILISGGSDGTIKQWEMIAKKSQESNGWRCEHWPRLSSQRMKRRSHLFQGHDGPISSLSCPTNDSSKLVSAGLDGTVRIWDPATGKELYRMDGFSSTVTSLCLDRERLVTDGMGEFVCVHDFDVDEDEYESGYDYLDF